MLRIRGLMISFNRRIANDVSHWQLPQSPVPQECSQHPNRQNLWTISENLLRSCLRCLFECVNGVNARCLLRLSASCMFAQHWSDIEELAQITILMKWCCIRPLLEFPNSMKLWIQCNFQCGLVTLQLDIFSILRKFHGWCDCFVGVFLTAPTALWCPTRQVDQGERRDCRPKEKRGSVILG